jgi:hypothetical protein
VDIVNYDVLADFLIVVHHKKPEGFPGAYVFRDVGEIAVGESARRKLVQSRRAFLGW